MALINCKECGKELSDSAEFCPHCGYKEKHEEQQTIVNLEEQNKNVVVQPVQSNIQESTNVGMQQSVQTNIQEPVNVGAQQPVQSNIQESIQNNYQQQTQGGVNSMLNKLNLKGFMKNKPATASIVVVVIALVIGLIIATSIFNGVQNSRKAIKVDISMTSYYGYIDDILDELGLDFDLVTAGANCYTGVQKSQFKTEKFGILHTEFRYCKSNKTLVFRVYNDENDQPLRDPKPGELATFDKYGEKISSGRNSL